MDIGQKKYNINDGLIIMNFELNFILIILFFTLNNEKKYILVLIFCHFGAEDG